MPPRSRRKKTTKSRTNPLLPIVIITFGVVLVLAAIFVQNLQPSSPAAMNDQPAAPQIQSNAEVPRVSLAEAKEAYDQGMAVFVDVRDTTSYAAGHIPGSLSIPLNDINTRISELNPQQWIITYCT